MRSILLAVAGVSLFASFAAAQSKPAADRVESLMSQLTLDEKISLLGGHDSMYTLPIERLGIPQLKFSDGPNGVRCWGKSTAYPAGVLLAATWDRSLAQAEGVQLGRDAKARGTHVLLGPGMNIYRHPRNGRNFEYFGEDPVLAGEIATGYVNGVQSQGVSAVVKHFAANNQETDRDTGSSEMDERTLRELYLPAFKRVVEQAHPGAVMCSYNRINGTWMSENHFLLEDVLRGEWKFDGIVMSDWGAVHGTIGPMNGGLDLEMPDAQFMNAKNIKPLLENGVVSQATLNTKVRRLLTWMNRFGWLDRDITDKSIPQENPDGARVALDIARAGITLLKNDGSLLPLDKAKLNHVVVMGPNAAHTPNGGGGSGHTDSFHNISIADGLVAALGKDKVRVVLGDSLSKLADHPLVDGGTFTAEFFDNKDLAGEPRVKQKDIKTIDFNISSNNSLVEGLPPGRWSARYHATITLAKTAKYTFFTRSDDGSRVLLDGKAIIDDWSDHGARTQTATVELKQGERHDIAIEYYDAGGAAQLRFGCGEMPDAFTAEDKEAIRTADAVIYCAGFSDETETEGSDRSYRLLNDQDQQIQSALASNPKTIVILNAGGSVDMTQWIDQTPALIHAYYAGQDGGTAIADVLLGDVNPSGHLPFSIEKQLSDVASEPHFGMKGPVEYAEGIFSGYRGYEHRKIEPRYPFGFGLSYTTFAASAPKATIDGDAIKLSVDVTNTGKRDGATVVQCYVAPPKIDLPRPVKELNAFERVTLKAGEKRTVELSIPRGDLAYFDPTTKAWAITPGEYKCFVGFNARDLPASTSVELKRD